MLETNLLPESERKFLRTEKLFRTVVFAFILGLVGIAVISGFFWAMRQIINIRQGAVEDELNTLQTQAKESEEGQIQQKVSELNSLATSYNNNLQNQPYWTTLWENLLAITPGGIKFDEFTGSSTDKILSIKGTALTRQDLMSFQDILEDSEFAASVEAPLSNIIEKENVPFEITVTLNEDALFTQ